MRLAEEASCQPHSMVGEGHAVAPWDSQSTEPLVCLSVAATVPQHGLPPMGRFPGEVQMSPPP